MQKHKRVSLLEFSIGTKAELVSLSKRRNWGNGKMFQLFSLLETLLIIPMDNEEIVELDAEIDAYNQGKLKDRPLGPRSRNLGKNDLWIAATTCLTKAILLTTDRDFVHLESAYISIEN